MLVRMLNSYEIMNAHFTKKGEKEFLHTWSIRYFDKEKDQLWVT